MKVFTADTWGGMDTSLCKCAWGLVFFLCRMENFHELQAENTYSVLTQLDTLQLMVVNAKMFLSGKHGTGNHRLNETI